MSNYIEQLKKTVEYTHLMNEEFYMHFSIPVHKSTTVRKYPSIHMLELSDIGWVYVNLCNPFDDRLPVGERIVLGYIMSKDVVRTLTSHEVSDQRDQMQVNNCLQALKDYKEKGKTNVLLPWDMATSAIILMSAMYACTKSMEQVGLTSKSRTIKEFMLEPINDTYMSLFKHTVDMLPLSQRVEVNGSLCRDDLKKIIMKDFYGSKSAIHELEENLHVPYERSKANLIPAHILHRDWAQATQAILEERGDLEVSWTDPISGMKAGWTCMDDEHADVVLEDGANFSAQRRVVGTPYHLCAAANPIHNGDAVLLWHINNAVETYNELEALKATPKIFTTYTTHDALNCSPAFVNQLRQWTIEGIIDIAMSSYMDKVSEDIGVPAPQTGDVAEWLQNLNPHGFLS